MFYFLLMNIHKKGRWSKFCPSNCIVCIDTSFFLPGKPCKSPGLRVICFIPDTGNKKQITPQSQELSSINILKKNVNKERRRMMSELIAKKFGTLFREYCLCLIKPYFFNEYRRLGRSKPARETRFFTDDGRVLNINQGK